MGFLRAILALSVVCAHAWPGGMKFVGGPNAVQLFYLISGFLISYILMEQHSYRRVGGFYANRALRLFPLYFLIATAALVFHALQNPSFFDLYRRMPADAAVLLSLANITILGQDWIMFTGVQNGALTLMADFRASEIPLYEALLVPQAWTLGLELSFYVLAPLILCHRPVFIGLLTASLAVKAALLLTGIGNTDPWSYRFFPAELSLFLAGSLAHQWGLPLARRWAGSRTWLPALATAITLLACTIYFLTPGRTEANSIPLLLLVLGALPFLFLFQNEHALDRKIGNFSYPLYLVHFLVITIVKAALGAGAQPLDKTAAILAIILSMAAAFLLEQHVSQPIERLRRKVRSQG